MEAWAESSSSSPSWSPSWGWACWRWWERSFMDAGSRTDASDSTDEEKGRAVPVAAVAAPERWKQTTGRQTDEAQRRKGAQIKEKL